MARPWRLLVIAVILTLALCIAAAAQERLDIGIITVKQKDLAEDLRGRIASGEDFAGLAKKHSVGPTANRGGRLGKVPLKRLRIEYRQAVKDLQPGQPSQVVPTEEGYSILYIFPDKPLAPAPSATPAPQLLPPPTTQVQPEGEIDVQATVQNRANRLLAEALESLAVEDVVVAEDRLNKALAVYPALETASLFKQAVQLAKESPQAKKALKSTALAMISLQSGAFDEAGKHFEEALAQKADFWPTMLMQAQPVCQPAADGQGPGSIKAGPEAESQFGHGPAVSGRVCARFRG